jgi:hypothetical protein
MRGEAPRISIHSSAGRGVGRRLLPPDPLRRVAHLVRPKEQATSVRLVQQHVTDGKLTNDDQETDEIFRQLRRYFDEPQIVELGLTGKNPPAFASAPVRVRGPAAEEECS